MIIELQQSALSPYTAEHRGQSTVTQNEPNQMQHVKFQDCSDPGCLHIAHV